MAIYLSIIVIPQGFLRLIESGSNIFIGSELKEFPLRPDGMFDDFTEYSYMHATGWKYEVFTGAERAFPSRH